MGGCLLKRNILGGGKPPDDDSSDSSNSSKLPRKLISQMLRDPFKDLPITMTKQPQFDLKLKIESVPKWDRNTDNIVRWFA
jgi:hypothetical protein